MKYDLDWLSMIKWPLKKWLCLTPAIFKNDCPTHQPDKYLLAGFTKAALGAWLLAKRRLEFVRGLSTRGFQKPVVQTIEGTLRLDLSLPNWQQLCFLTFYVEPKDICFVFLLSFFPVKHHIICFPPATVAHWWVINMRKRSTTVSTSPSYQEIFGLVSPLGERADWKSRDTKTTLKTQKGDNNNPEIHCNLIDNRLLHQLYLNVLAGHIPSPQPTWHE